MTLFKPKIIAGLLLTALVFRGTDSVLVLLVLLRPRTSTSSTKNLEMTIVYLIFRRFFGFVGCLGYGYIEFVNCLSKAGSPIFTTSCVTGTLFHSFLFYRYALTLMAFH